MIRQRPAPSELVNQYVDEVLRGDGIGRYERWMVERHLQDLKTGADRGWYFDDRQAFRACEFFPTMLHHTAGEWAGEPFTLLPHQAFWVWSIEGWRSAETKKRRFRKALIYIARKNGKTQLAAAFCAKELIGHPRNFPEKRGQVICAATKEEQATLCWQAAQDLIDASEFDPALFRVTGRNNLKNSGTTVVLDGENAGSWMKAIGSDGRNQDGLGPHLVVKDELHAWRPRHMNLDDKLSSGGGARKQPLELIITTAGDDESDILAEELEFCKHIVSRGAEGSVVDDTVFAAIYQVDDEDEDKWLTDETLWRKANPGLGHTPRREYIRAQIEEAKSKPSAKRRCEQFYMNRTVAGNEQAFPPELWSRGRSCLIFDADTPAFGGLDLASTNDFAASALVWPRQIDGEWHYGIRSHTWACDGHKHKSKIRFDRSPFREWIQDGHVTLDHEELLSTVPIKQWWRDAYSTYDIQTVAYDKMRCTEMAAELLNIDGMPMASMPQTWMRYEPAAKEFTDALEAGRVHHEDDPCLSWQANNCCWDADSRDRRMPQKAGKVYKKKIDAISAVLMAMAAAIEQLQGEETALPVG